MKATPVKDYLMWINGPVITKRGNKKAQEEFFGILPVQGKMNLFVALYVGSSAGDQADDKKHQENKEQYLSDTCCTCCNTTKTENSCYNSHN
jgi:hypothetical protein